MKLFAFDIETKPLPDERIEEIAPEFKPESVKTGNLTDLKKINDKINEARTNHFTKIKGRAALEAEYGEIVAIGTITKCDEDEDAVTELLHLNAQGTEEAMLSSFWVLAEEYAASQFRLVGHNIFGFDLPFLVRRSYAHGVPIPASLLPNRGRYWGLPWFDTMSAWAVGEFQARISLDRFAKHLGIEGKNGSGEHFGKLYAEDEEAALDYLRNDLRITLEVSEKLLPLLMFSEVGL
jgi:hypothetical protein